MITDNDFVFEIIRSIYSVVSSLIPSVKAFSTASTTTLSISAPLKPLVFETSLP